MALLKLFDSTGDTTTTTGTGTLTGTGTPPTGYQSPSSAGIANSDNMIIRIETTDGATWEICESVYTTSGTTWSRGTLQASSTGSRINFGAGTKNIKVVISKEALAQAVLTTAGDILYGDGTKLAALAAGTKNYALLSGGAATAPGYAKVPISYSVTTANADNTASLVHILSITVPANTWADGETIVFKFVTDLKQNSGSAMSFTPGFSWDGNNSSAGASSVPNNATEGIGVLRECAITRIGTSLYFNGGATPTTFLGIISNATGAAATGTGFGASLSSQSFSSDATLTVDVTWASANSLTFYKILGATAFKI